MMSTWGSRLTLQSEGRSGWSGAAMQAIGDGGNKRSEKASVEAAGRAVVMGRCAGQRVADVVYLPEVVVPTYLASQNATGFAAEPCVRESVRMDLHWSHSTPTPGLVG